MKSKMSFIVIDNTLSPSNMIFTEEGKKGITSICFGSKAEFLLE